MLKVVKNVLTTTLFCVVFFMAFNVKVLAETETNKETVTQESIDYFDWSRDDLVDLVSANEINVFNSPATSISEIENFKREMLKDFGPLKLTTGFVRERITTFSRSKSIFGTAKEGTIVGLYVFHLETVNEAIEHQIVGDQDHLTTIGKSGLYNETINIDHIGANYVFIVTKDPSTFEVTYRLFKVILKEVETRDKLENITINFFEGSTSGTKIQELVPNITGYGF